MDLATAEWWCLSIAAMQWAWRKLPLRTQGTAWSKRSSFQRHSGY